MSRQYTKIEEYEETILQMKAKGCTRREIAEKVNITPDQVHQFLCRYNRKQRNIKVGVLPKKKGRRHVIISSATPEKSIDNIPTKV